jgi:hypothetical protein
MIEPEKKKPNLQLEMKKIFEKTIPHIHHEELRKKFNQSQNTNTNGLNFLKGLATGIFSTIIFISLIHGFAGQNTEVYYEGVPVGVAQQALTPTHDITPTEFLMNSNDIQNTALQPVSPFVLEDSPYKNADGHIDMKNYQLNLENNALTDWEINKITNESPVTSKSEIFSKNPASLDIKAPKK